MLSNGVDASRDPQRNKPLTGAANKLATGFRR
jgi:hypothetical protein